MMTENALRTSFPCSSTVSSFMVAAPVAEMFRETWPSAALRDISDIRMNRAFLSLRAKIGEFGALKKDWNGYGAPPIPPEVLDAANWLLLQLRMANRNLDGWEVFPTARETVQFEKTVGKDYFEIEVYSRNRFALYAEGSVGVEMESADLADVMEKLSAVWGR